MGRKRSSDKPPLRFVDADLSTSPTVRDESGKLLPLIVTIKMNHDGTATREVIQGDAEATLAESVLRSIAKEMEAAAARESREQKRMAESRPQRTREETIAEVMAENVPPQGKPASPAATARRGKGIPAEVQRIADAWPRLPENVKRAMLALIG
jgi:hypothetical protein